MIFSSIFNMSLQKEFFCTASHRFSDFKFESTDLNFFLEEMFMNVSVLTAKLISTDKCLKEKRL